MDHRQSDGPPSLHTPQHLIEGSPQQPPRKDPFPRPSYAPPDGAVRGRGLTGRGLPSLCYSCLKQLPAEDLVLGYCYHNYCQECVVEMVKGALESDHMYPVRCCKIMIPLDWDTLQMPQEAVDKYNRRKREIEARGTTYCYRNACRAPIHPKFIVHGEALCTTCKGSTCVRCKKAFHEGLTCGERETQEEQRLHDLTVTYGWGKCSHCENYIQLSVGCNHLSCLCGADTCFSCGRAWQTCDCIQPDHNAVTDELGRIVQAQVDSGGFDSILHNLRRRVSRPMLIKYENYMTERMERHLAEAKRIQLGIKAITTSGGLRPEPCKHERWVLHQITYVPCDFCGILPTGFTQSCMYCLIQVCQNCRVTVDQTKERD